LKCKFCILIVLILTCTISFSQTTDSTHAAPHRDSFYTVHENMPKSKLWGNSWYMGGSYNLSKVHEFDLNIGRTYGTTFCSGGGCIITSRSWGAGYSLATKNNSTAHLVKAFGEYSFFYFPPLSYTLRAEYIYDVTNKTHYLRPSAGLNLILIDILYNYSFNLSGTDNLFKHGVTFRFKYFHKQKNWQKSHPSVCMR